MAVTHNVVCTVHEHHELVTNEDRVIPHGFIEGSVLVDSGTVTINGVPYTAGQDMSWEPIPFKVRGSDYLRRPSVPLVADGGGAVYKLHYTTLPQ